ncbi:MAG TPA: alpha/beta hydrolase [Ktedonobacteraceae bacterium]
MKEIASSPFGASLRSDPKLMREITRALYPSDPLGYCYQLWAAVGWSSMPWLWSLRQPTLILSGDDDPLVPLANAKIDSTFSVAPTYNRSRVYQANSSSHFTRTEKINSARLFSPVLVLHQNGLVHFEQSNLPGLT